MAELHFFTGTMDSGKSTLALQTDHNHAARGRAGRIFTRHDRAGAARVSSRLGLVRDAGEVTAQLDFWRHVVDALTHYPGNQPHTLKWLEGNPKAAEDAKVALQVKETQE
jgi:thymidine kinase